MWLLLWRTPLLYWKSRGEPMDGDELDQLFLTEELQLCQELGRTLMLNKQQAVQRIQI